MKTMATGSTTHLVLGFFSQLLSDTHGVTAPVFSPDGRRVAYAAHRDKDAVVLIVDGEAGPTFSSVAAGPVFSPDGQHVALVASQAGTKTLVVDGAKVGRGVESGTDFIASITFAPDNRRVAYLGITGGSWYERGFTRRAKRRVYVDGVAHPEYNAKAVGGLQFTSDGNHLIYVVARASEASRDVSFVVVDGAEGKRYDYVSGAPRLDPNGRSVNYSAQAGRKVYLVTQSLE
jgi:Tol biopolymer transport system component